jgi:hypothetical protein
MHTIKNADYFSPEVEIVTVVVEAGFQLSDTTDLEDPNQNAPLPWNTLRN